MWLVLYLRFTTVELTKATSATVGRGKLILSPLLFRTAKKVLGDQMTSHVVRSQVSLLRATHETKQT